jgi:Mg2+ and Co2+ transporter CorA
MKKIVTLNESELKNLIKTIIEENDMNEGIFDSIVDFGRGVKGAKRGWGYDYFNKMSKLERLILKLTKLDKPNESVMNELTALRDKINSLNIPQERKEKFLKDIGQTLQTWKWYSKAKSDIIKNLETLNLNSWT